MRSTNVFCAILIFASAYSALAENTVHTEKIDAFGTKITTDKSNDVSVDSSGAVSSSESAKTVVDPKGVNNKITAKAQTDVQVKPNGDYKKVATRTTADGTDVKVKQTKATSKHWTDNGQTTTLTTTKAIDPKGLGNKTTTEVETKVDQNPDGSVAKKTVTEKVNGSKVSESTSSAIK